MNTIKLYWWQPPNYPSWHPKKYISSSQTRYKDVEVNFGDELSEFIVSKVLEKKIIRAKATEENKLLGIGSILHFAKNNDIVWGSGINGKKRELNANGSTLSVLSVRGPLTREFLMYKNCYVPKIYGDPALLLKQIHPIKDFTTKKDYIIIPHFSEINLPLFQKYRDHLVLPNQKPEQVISEILQSKFVISSSLHGVIVAESYNIPAILLKITSNEPLFKYMDYYYGTERFKFKYAKSIEEALDIGGMPPPLYDAQKMIDVLKSHFKNI